MYVGTVHVWGSSYAHHVKHPPKMVSKARLLAFNGLTWIRYFKLWMIACGGDPTVVCTYSTSQTKMHRNYTTGIGKYIYW